MKDKKKNLSRTLYKTPYDEGYLTLKMTQETVPNEIKYKISGNHLELEDIQRLKDLNYPGGYEASDIMNWLPDEIFGIVDPAPQRMTWTLCYTKGYFGGDKIHTLAYMDPPFHDEDSCIYYNRSKHDPAYFNSSSFLEVTYNMLIWYLENCYNNPDYIRFVKNSYEIGGHTHLKLILDHLENEKES